MEEQRADLTSIARGGALEKFAAELQVVLDNIRDPNTDADAKRKIVLEFVFQPADNREKIFTSITARSVLGATKPIGDILYVGKEDGANVATVLQGQDPRQGVLEISPGKRAKAGDV